LKDYSGLLEIAATASPDEVKRAFRLQIARYHPDKVQHLGKEFQNMAADRAAELTEAYRILSDQARRDEYDRARAASPGSTPTQAPPAPSKPAGPETQTAAPAGEARTAGAKESAAFSAERAVRDEFVRKATIARFKQALAAIGSEYDESEVRGFDIARVPKAKLFGRGKGPRLLGRFVTRVDSEAVADAWLQAGKWAVPSNEEICVFLMGPGMAPSRELAEAIARHRRQPTRGGKVTLIPVDARNWDAHVPTDAPEVAKNLLARLRGTR
jgi:curved DNA-binding protein CbpA